MSLTIDWNSSPPFYIYPFLLIKYQSQYEGTLLLIMEHQILSKAIELAKNPKVQIGAGVLLGLKSLQHWSVWYTKRKVNNHVHDPPWNWSREIVVVTGGSSGIGAAVVSKFAGKGIKVLILDRNPPHKLCESLLCGHSYITYHIALLRSKDDKLWLYIAANTYFYQIDLTDSEAISSVADRIRVDHGNPTVLINNAGLANTLPVLEIPEAKLRAIFNLNIIAPILLTQHFLPSMVKHNHGHIVNVASQASFATQATNVDYGATKSGLLAFHEGLGQELRHLYKAPRVRTRSVSCFSSCENSCSRFIVLYIPLGL